MSKELPVLYAIYDDQGLVHTLKSESDVACRMLPGRTLVKYIPDVTHCRDCVHLVPISQTGNELYCNEFHGLNEPKQDGSDYCPYAKRKEQTP